MYKVSSDRHTLINTIIHVCNILIEIIHIEYVSYTIGKRLSGNDLSIERERISLFPLSVSISY